MARIRDRGDSDVRGAGDRDRNQTKPGWPPGIRAVRDASVATGCGARSCGGWEVECGLSQPGMGGMRIRDRADGDLRVPGGIRSWRIRSQPAGREEDGWLER